MGWAEAALARAGFWVVLCAHVHVDVVAAVVLVSDSGGSVCIAAEVVACVCERGHPHLGHLWR